jgi:hypothetical protein
LPNQSSSASGLIGDGLSILLAFDRPDAYEPAEHVISESTTPRWLVVSPKVPAEFIKQNALDRVAFLLRWFLMPSQRRKQAFVARLDNLNKQFSHLRRKRIYHAAHNGFHTPAQLLA